MKTTALCCLLTMAIYDDNYAQNYRWPLKIKPKLSSLFGDYRADHWHSGIDITTRGKTGYKVYAIENGYISRIKTSFWGYGKALYLKLNDGRYAVYGHLQRFSPEIEEYVRRQQMKEKRYYRDINFHPGQFPVKKGGYIALSGQTGAGAPHLHFEIRNRDNITVNPLKDYYNLPDSRSPVADYIVVKRYKSYGLANYHDMEFLKLNGENPNLLVTDTVAIYGQAVFAVSAYDPNGGYNYGLYGASVILDGSEIFSFEHNHLDYSTGSQIDYVRDNSLKMLVEKNKGIKADNDKNAFYRLYIQPDDRQLFYSDYGYPDGIIDAENIASGIHSLLVNLVDISGNDCRIQLYLKKAKFKKPVVTNVYTDSISYILELGSFPASHKPQIQVRKAPYLPYNTIPAYFNIFERTVKFLSSNDAYDYRVRIIDEYSDFSPWVVFNPRANSSEIIPYADFLEIIVPKTNLAALGDFKSQYLDVLPLNDDYIKVLAPVLNSNGFFEPELILKSGIDGFYIFDSGGIACSPDSTVRLQVLKNQLYDPAIMQVTEPVFNGAGGYTFDILPADLLFKDEAIIQVEKRQLALKVSHSSLYYYSYKKDKWYFIGEKSDDFIQGVTRGGGKFGVLVDDTPPRIWRIRPKNNSKTKNRTPLLSCKITDDLSGFKKEIQFEMTIDGIWVPAYYDIDEKDFSYQVRNPLKTGWHTLHITVFDNQGNRSSTISRFKVTGK